MPSEAAACSCASSGVGSLGRIVGASGRGEDEELSGVLEVGLVDDDDESEISSCPTGALNPLDPAPSARALNRPPGIAAKMLVGIDGGVGVGVGVVGGVAGIVMVGGALLLPDVGGVGVVIVMVGGPLPPPDVGGVGVVNVPVGVIVPPPLPPEGPDIPVPPGPVIPEPPGPDPLLPEPPGPDIPVLPPEPESELPGIVGSINVPVVGPVGDDGDDPVALTPVGELDEELLAPLDEEMDADPAGIDVLDDPELPELLDEPDPPDPTDTVPVPEVDEPLPLVAPLPLLRLSNEVPANGARADARSPASSASASRVGASASATPSTATPPLAKFAIRASSSHELPSVETAPVSGTIPSAVVVREYPTGNGNVDTDQKLSPPQTPSPPPGSPS